MQTIHSIICTITLLSVTAVAAQENISVQAKEPAMGNSIGMETTEKTYEIDNGKEVIKNSVKITTEIMQDVQFEDEDMGKIDQDRIHSPKRIIKTILIDNDDDDAYEEKIVFSYKADDRTNFALVSNDDEILIAVEDGENLKILESESIAISGINDPKETYVFTDDAGNNIEFIIESYSVINEQ